MIIIIYIIMLEMNTYLSYKSRLYRSKLACKERQIYVKIVFYVYCINFFKSDFSNDKINLS